MCHFEKHDCGNHFTTSTSWHPPKGWKIVHLLWNFSTKCFLCQYHFWQISKLKRYTKKNIQNSTNMYSCEKTFYYFQLWHPPKGWNFTYLPWNFRHKIPTMLITCVQNLKVKKIIQKKKSTIYQHVYLWETMGETISVLQMLVDFKYLFL